MKVICQHVKLLRQRGHHVLAVYRAQAVPHATIPTASTHGGGTRSVPNPISAQQLSGSGNEGAMWRESATSPAPMSLPPPLRAMPPWSDVAADEELLLGPNEHLASTYPACGSLDVVVCGMFQQV